MATLTLTRMARGGLFDQLGGGFYRYTVDQRWEIPHFEKMLYDNAQLLAVYAQAAAATGETLFARAATRTADWMLHELRANSGSALYCSLDADSEGHEGKFYVWTPAQVRAALNPLEWQLFAEHFGLDAAPNFEGQWHLTVRMSRESQAERHQLPIDQLDATLESARGKLMRLREQRVRPALDDKILASWNALAISGLASAARLLDRDDYAHAATAALQYLRAKHWREGRLLATSAGAEARLPAYLDDYAFLLDAILELSSVRFRAEELSWAIELANVMLEHFEDPRDGGFFFTADDHEALISRPKSFADEAVPAGNALAARALLRLGFLLGEARYLQAAERALRAAWPAVLKYPQGHAATLLALEDYLTPPQIVVLRGPAGVIEPWRYELNRVFAPRRWTIAVSDDQHDLPAALASKPPAAQGAAYVCRGLSCSAALTDFPTLLAELQRAVHDA